MFSFSAINTFKMCKFRYKLHYIDKLFLFEETEAIKLGIRIHENIYNYLCKNESLDRLITSNLQPIKNALDRSDIQVLEQKQTVGQYIYIPDFLAIKNNKALCCDWKTGKSKTFKYITYMQLDFYAMLIFQQYPEVEEIYSRYMYVLSNSIFKKRYHRQQHLSTLIDFFTQIVEEIKTEKEFKQTESALCNYCVYRKRNMCVSEK